MRALQKVEYKFLKQFVHEKLNFIPLCIRVIMLFVMVIRKTVL